MGFSDQSRSRVGPVLPLASMVDIMFLLLIFFLATSAMREQDLQIDVTLPGYESQADVAPKSQTVITVTEDNEVYLGGQVCTMPELREKLRRLADVAPDEAILIRGADKSRYGTILRVVDLTHLAGFENVSEAVSALDSSD